MGLFSSDPADRVCGIAIDDYGLRITTMACDDRSQSSPADNEFVSMIDAPGGSQPSGLDETFAALAGPATPMLEIESLGPIRTVTVGEGYADRLATLYDAIDDDGWTGETVVALPADYAESAEEALADAVEDAGFDVRQVVSHDVATSVCGAVDYEIDSEEYGSHPIVAVDLGLWEITVTVAAVNLDEGRVRIRGRETIDAGLAKLLEVTGENALVDAGVPEEAIDLSATVAMHSLAREVFDPATDSTTGTVEIGGERLQIRVGTEHFIDLFADMTSVAESLATELVLEAGYAPRELDRVIVSGFGSEGESGEDLTHQIAARFTSDDSLAAEVGPPYAPERVFFGNGMTPDLGAADVAREARDLDRDVQVLETLDVEAS
ncbi:hypothetical protein [Halolamina rubra]|uniref:hypothetical protein n=1 Tax=Halolamina rubra TaxID=1380430 RepID=UPI000679E8E8|nr:hypothetical protein [Halolamina rubra]